MNTLRMKPAFAVSLAILCLLAGVVNAAVEGTVPGQQATVPRELHNGLIRALPVGQCKIGDVCQLKVAVSDVSGKPLEGIPVLFSVNGQDYTVHDIYEKRVTGPDGTTYANLYLRTPVDNGLHIGSNALGVRIDRSKVDPAKIDPSVPDAMLADSSTFHVVKGAPKFILYNNSVKQSPRPPAADGNKFAFMASLQEQAGGGGNKQVRLVFQGKTYKVTADPFFEVEIPLNKSDLGKTIPVEMHFDGDGLFNPVTHTYQAQFEGLMPEPWGYSAKGANVTSPQVRLGESVDVKVHIHSVGSKPAPLPNMPFFLIARDLYQVPNGYIKMGSGVTDSQGNAVIHYKHTKAVAPGNTYQMIVAYNNNGTEYDSSVPPSPGDTRGNLIVLATGLDAAVTAPSSAIPGEEVTVKVRITRSTDHAPAASAKSWLHSTDPGWTGSDDKKSADDKGEATYTFKVTDDPGMTPQRFRVEGWGGEKYYSGFSKDFSIAIVSRSSQRAGAAANKKALVEVRDASVVYGQEWKLQAAIKSQEAGNPPVKGAEVVFKVNGVARPAVFAGDDGVAVLVLNGALVNLKQGTYPVEVAFTGRCKEGGFAPARGTGKLNAQRAGTAIDLQFKTGSTMKYFSGELKFATPPCSTYYTIGEQTVKVSGDLTGAHKTFSTGAFSFSVPGNPDLSDYTVEVKFGGNDYLLPSSAKMVVNPVSGIRKLSKPASQKPKFPTQAVK